MLIVPTQAKPSQIITVSLSDYDCLLRLYQKFYGLFMDVTISNDLVVAGVLCLNLNKIVRSPYLRAPYPGFGDLCFVDNKGSLDPWYTSLGDRYSLAYLEIGDLDAAGLI